MSSKPHIVVPSLIGATVLVMIAQKMMIPFAGRGVIILLDALAGYFLVSSLVVKRQKKANDVTTVSLTLNNLVYTACTFALLINLQHWRGAELWSKITFITILAFSIFLVKNLGAVKKMTKVNKRNNYLAQYVPFGFFLVMISLTVILTPRQFYNLFHGNTYEQFVRTRYPEAIATEYINLSKPIDERSQMRAAQLLEEAKQKINAEQYDEGLKLLNKSIDMNPDEPSSYYERGMLRLTKLDINKYTAKDAMDDFSRAIKLKPDMAMAYYQRAAAKRYLYPHQPALINDDISKAAMLDSMSRKTSNTLVQ